MSGRVAGTGRGRMMVALSAAAQGRPADSVTTKAVSFSDAPATQTDLVNALVDLKHLAWARGLNWQDCERCAEEIFLKEGGA